MSVNRIALAGNPNTGKSTLFNTLTGLKQHTGNWPGKTVIHAEGSFEHKGQQYVLVDLPGPILYFPIQQMKKSQETILFLTNRMQRLLFSMQHH